MRKNLVRIAPLQCGIVSGSIYAALSLLVVPFFLLAGLAAAAHPHANGQRLPPFPLFGVFALFLPVIYGVVGFLGGLLMAAVYNLLARFTGGLEVTVEDVRPDFT
ncbi:MAG: hypothetical protein ABSH19_07910 [Opitutales bacterium]|jgi:Ca2+/Na+ antiporter